MSTMQNVSINGFSVKEDAQFATKSPSDHDLAPPPTKTPL